MDLPQQHLCTPKKWSDRKSTRLNSSHVRISYAVFCLKKKKTLLSMHDTLTDINSKHASRTIASMPTPSRSTTTSAPAVPLDQDSTATRRSPTSTNTTT